MAWTDNINTWTGLPIEVSIRKTEINGESASMVWPTLGLRTAKEQKSNTFTYVLNKAGVKRELLDTVKTRKLAYHVHTMNKGVAWRKR